MDSKSRRTDEQGLQHWQKKVIAVLGYGSQGRAHAQNLRDSGLDVLVAQRPGSQNYDDARKDGFVVTTIPEAVDRAEILLLGLPDQRMGEIFAAEMAAGLQPGQTLGFMHGFAIRFGLIAPPPDIDVILVAPKGPGPLVRDAFLRGGGVAAIVSVHQDSSGRAKASAMAWAEGIGASRGGLIEASFAEECESDLFGEQTVLTGGVIELMKAAYEVLVESGCPDELAYFECVHELKQIVDLQYAGGLELLRSKISGTAAYGGLTRGPRLISDRTRAVMREILAEIKSGTFAREWVDESRSGGRRLAEMLTREAAHPSEAAGHRIRSLAGGSQRVVAGPPSIA